MIDERLITSYIWKLISIASYVIQICLNCRLWYLRRRLIVFIRILSSIYQITISNIIILFFILHTYYVKWGRIMLPIWRKIGSMIITCLYILVIRHFIYTYPILFTISTYIYCFITSCPCLIQCFLLILSKCTIQINLWFIHDS